MLDFFKNLDEKFSCIFSFVVSYPQASKYSVNWKSQLSLSPWKKSQKKYSEGQRSTIFVSVTKNMEVFFKINLFSSFWNVGMDY